MATLTVSHQGREGGREGGAKQVVENCMPAASNASSRTQRCVARLSPSERALLPCPPEPHRCTLHQVWQGAQFGSCQGGSVQRHHLPLHQVRVRRNAFIGGGRGGGRADGKGGKEGSVRQASSCRQHYHSSVAAVKGFDSSRWLTSDWTAWPGCKGGRGEGEGHYCVKSGRLRLQVGGGGGSSDGSSGAPL